MKRTFLKRHRRGFTLVEILIGLIISVLIIGAATTTYLAAAKSWDTTRTRTGSYQCARAAFEIMEREIRAAIPPDPDRNLVFEGETAVIEDTELDADTLRFSTTGATFSPSRFASSDLAEVMFYLDVDKETGEPKLMMTRRHFATSYEEDFPAEEEELAPRVVSFNVEYYDGIEFVEEWYEEKLPEAVRITLYLYDFDAEEDAIFFQKLIALNRREG